MILAHKETFFISPSPDDVMIEIHLNEPNKLKRINILNGSLAS